MASASYRDADPDAGGRRAQWWATPTTPRSPAPRRIPPSPRGGRGGGGQILEAGPAAAPPDLRRALRELARNARGPAAEPASSSPPPPPALRSVDAKDDSDSVFHRSGGFVYIRNFFSPRDYAVLLDACREMRPRAGAERRACARQRLGVMIEPEHVVHRAFMNPRVAERISGLVGRRVVPADVPVEYRVYPEGAAMDWHQDVALYVEPQYELVFTLENTSDSQTQWQDADGRRRGGWTEPNSIIMVRAESVVHRVTPVLVGERSIVKFAYTTTLDKTEEYYDNLLTYE